MAASMASSVHITAVLGVWWRKECGSCDRSGNGGNGAAEASRLVVEALPVGRDTVGAPSSAREVRIANGERGQVNRSREVVRRSLMAR